MRIELKLMTAFPHVKRFEASFMSKPNVGFILRPLKALDLMDVSYLKLKKREASTALTYRANILVAWVEYVHLSLKRS